MNKINFNHNNLPINCLAGFVMISLTALAMLSFKIQKESQVFLKQLGISEAYAMDIIESNIIFGNFDVFGLSKAKNISVQDRTKTAMEILDYIKIYTKSEAFKNTYHQMRAEKKPEMISLPSPQDMQRDLINTSKASLIEIQALYERSDASLKPVYENLLIEVKKQLKAAEDSNSPMLLAYKNNYETTLKNVNEGNKKLISDWEMEFPENHLEFVKKRLNQYLEETEGIDFNAVLISKDGKKIFADQRLENKSSRWKLAFKCGKDVVDQSRKYVLTWMTELP